MVQHLACVTQFLCVQVVLMMETKAHQSQRALQVLLQASMSLILMCLFEFKGMAMYMTMYMTPQVHGCMVQHPACVTQFLCVQVDQRVLMMVKAIAMLMDLKDVRMREKWPSHNNMQVLVLHSLVVACLSSTLSRDANNFLYLHTYSSWHA